MAVGGGGGRVAWAGATCVLVGGASAYALWGAHGPLGVSDRSGLVSMAVALPALVVSVIGLLWARPGAHEDETAAVARLVREVRSVGEPQWMHSLGGELTPIDVTFAFRPYVHARAAELPPTPAGQLERVVEDYRAVRPRRLVITGEPGAGKTVLARKLVMELNKARGAGEPVAVLMALADWDTREELTDWVVRHLERDFGMPRRSARKVMDARVVLPVLDGLDEMDAADVGAADSRALEALARYQDGTDPAPLVLTCRTRRYDELEAEGSHILDAARIEIDPVDSVQAVRFLELRGAARRPAVWRPVLDDLLSAPDGVLASALSTPWRLALAATVYEREGDPGELVRSGSAEAIAELLLGRFIGAVAGWAPERVGRYQERTVHMRLHRLAVGLETDVVLHRLGDRVAGAVRAVVVGGLVTAGLAPMAAAAVQRSVRPAELWVCCVAAVVSGCALVRELRSAPLGSQGDSVVSAIALPPLGDSLWRLALRRGWRRVWRLVAVILVLACLVAEGPDVVSTLFGSQSAFLLAASGWFCVAAVAVAVMDDLDSTAVGPSGPLRAAWCVVVLAAGVVPVAITTTSNLRLTDTAFAAVLLVMLLRGMREWVGYLVHRLANPRLGPRLPTFLDWCVTAGLLRTSGIAYQFRHREFQEWLVRHPRPVH
ncbi:NACHT domain-containing protein [Streptomyces sp. TLI_55]|uniref:NACHT domain-containing protein n=1 Tax=Streptomyces sp. TLI_55 TaxID=1938861 RepID=UPI0015CF0C5B|nr:NACHT domain-containing protein [Streptomyces sp. TLI_55]